jgi:hypothetical protein
MHKHSPWLDCDLGSLSVLTFGIGALSALALAIY